MKSEICACKNVPFSVTRVTDVRNPICPVCCLPLIVKNPVKLFFKLPIPPSINRTYGVSDRRMYKRKNAEDWETEAGWILRSQMLNKDPFSGSVAVGIRWFVKTDRDIDAGIKILLDLLQKCGVYENDRQVRRIDYVEIFPSYFGPRVELEVREYADL